MRVKRSDPTSPLCASCVDGDIHFTTDEELGTYSWVLVDGHGNEVAIPLTDFPSRVEAARSFFGAIRIMAAAGAKWMARQDAARRERDGAIEA